MKNLLISVFIFSLSPLVFAYPTLHSAAGTGDLNRIHEILESGFSVNLLAEEDLTPLHSAARRGQAEAVSLLLDRGANPDLETPKGTTALEMALSEGHGDVVAIFESRGLTK